MPESLGHLPQVQTYTGALKDRLLFLWTTHQGLIFGLASGAVVRLIAPLLGHKAEDPAVVVVDETGQYAISLCSGHLGGADVLARCVAVALNGTAIVTGASAAAHLPSLDGLGTPFGWQRGTGDWNEVSAAVAREKAVLVEQDIGTELWKMGLPTEHPYHLKQILPRPTALAFELRPLHQQKRIHVLPSTGTLACCGWGLAASAARLKPRSSRG